MLPSTRQCWNDGDARPRQGSGLPICVEVRHDHRHQRYRGADGEEIYHRGRGAESRPAGGTVPRWTPQRRRTLPQYRRGMDGCERPVDNDHRERPSKVPGHSSDGFFWSQGQHSADQADGRDARVDVRQQGEGHRASNQGKLPRGAQCPGVLHFDEGRPQGVDRHCPANRRQRLPHTPPDRRGAGSRRLDPRNWNRDRLLDPERSP